MSVINTGVEMYISEHIFNVGVNKFCLKKYIKIFFKP